MVHCAPLFEGVVAGVEQPGLSQAATDEDGNTAAAQVQLAQAAPKDIATNDLKLRESLAKLGETVFTPIDIALMERHPLGSQLFAPMQDRPWLVVVCGDPRDASTYRAFRATGRQGVNYARNVWHHPLLVLDANSLFLVVDRAGPGNNLEEVELDAAERLSLAP